MCSLVFTTFLEGRGGMCNGNQFTCVFFFYTFMNSSFYHCVIRSSVSSASPRSHVLFSLWLCHRAAAEKRGSGAKPRWPRSSVSTGVFCCFVLFVCFLSVNSACSLVSVKPSVCLNLSALRHICGIGVCVLYVCVSECVPV